MAGFSSSSVFKLLWQAVLLLALVAAAWVLGQMLPGWKTKILTQIDKTSTLSSGESGKTGENPSKSENPNIYVYALPRTGDSAALKQITDRVASAKKEVFIVARQLAATSILSAIKDRIAAGVTVTTLLSPDTTVDFPRSRLANWMRDNRISGVYRDVMNSASHLIIIDSKVVVISDLPFSQRAFAPADNTAASASALGFVYVIEDPRLASGLVESLRPRAQPQNKML